MARSKTGSVATLVAVALCGTILLSAQEVDRTVNPAERLALGGMMWKVEGSEGKIENHMGRESLYLRDAAATLESVEFTEGTIEYDVSVPTAWSFMGNWFRDNNMGTHEQFYLRPKQTGQDDALQYMPKFHEIAGWQLYIGDGYAANVEIKFGDWNHVKIAVNDDRAEIYFNDMAVPAIVIRELKTGINSGSFGFFTAYQGAHFSNIRIDQSTAPSLNANVPAQFWPSPGMILEWDISSPFPEGDVTSVNKLPKSFSKKLKWTPTAVEDSGLVNIARLHGRDNGNTSFARVIINSSKKQIVRLRFGYSDEVTVFLNNKRLYYGQNIWHSRDFRYLGTIGLFDDVPLDLKRGKNELLLAITENFGGWGVMGKLPVDNSINIVK